MKLMQKTRWLIALSASIAATQMACGQSGIYVEFWSSSNPGDQWAAVPGYPNRHAGAPGLSSGSDISITNANSVPYRIFAVDDANFDIGDVSISASNSNTQPILLIGRGFTLPNAMAPLTTPACRHLGRVSYGTGKPRLQIRVNGDLRDAIDAWEVVRIDATGELQGQVSHQPTGASPPPLGTISVGSIGSSGSVFASPGNIDRVFVAGTVRGPIKSVSGTIGLVETTGTGTSHPIGQC